MTSEVLIMNERGIALAADSASTVGGYKIYKADKLFELSRSQPLSAMVYGMGSLDGVPLDLLVSEFRHFIGVKGHRFSSVEECSECFLKFLETGGSESVDGNPIITSGYVDSHIYHSLVRMIQRIDRKFRHGSYKRMMGAGGDASLKDVLDMLVKRSESKNDPTEVRTVSEAISGSLERSGYGIKLSSLKVWTDPELRDRLFRIYVNGIVSKGGFGEYCGIIIAGYGSSEYMPSYREYRIYGLFPTGLCYSIKSDARIDPATPSYIGTFAQDDVMNSFIDGIDRKLLQVITNGLSQTVNGVVTSLSDFLPQDTDIDLLIKANDEAVAQFNKSLLNYVKVNYRSPIERSVRFLSKDEMGVLAESLVQSTSLRRHVSDDVETVGGPIDVSFISRNEGFIWIKRKHYFDSALNLSYLMRRGNCRDDNNDP